MDPITASLKQFQKQAHAFVSDQSKRMLCIIAASQHTGMLAKVLRGEEWFPDNKSPFIIIDTPWLNKEEDLTETICHHIKEHYNILVEGFKKDGVTLPEFAGTMTQDDDPIDLILADILTLTHCTKEHLKPPVFCWLPSTAQKVPNWIDTVLYLFEELQKYDIRLVISVEKDKFLKPIVKKWQETVSIIHYDYSPDESNDYFEKLFAPPSAGHAQGTPSGSAAPDVEPPPRKIQPPSDDKIKEALKELNLPPTLTAQQAEALRTAIFAAAFAAGKQDEERTINEQLKACSICEEAGVKLEHALMRLTLANYYLQFEMEDEAKQEYATAESIAAEIPAYTQLAQIRMAQAFIRMRKKKWLEEAIHYYEQATAAAAIGESWLLYLESLRMLGTCHVKLKDTDMAIECWQAAVCRGEKMDKTELIGSSFLDIAARFIKLLEKEGLDKQAESVEKIVAEVGAQYSTEGSSAA
jgi:hypothetical protein